MNDGELLEIYLRRAGSTLPMDLQIGGGIRTQRTALQVEITEADAEALIAKVEDFSRGYDVITECIICGAKGDMFQAHVDLAPIEIKKLLLDDDSFELGIEELIENRFAHTTSLLEIFEYDEDELINLYEVADQLYNEAQIDKAILAFSFLTYVHPGISSFWKGLGLSYERNQNTAEAISAFKMAMKFASDFSPFYDMIRCCKKTEEFNELLEDLKKIKSDGLFPEDIDEAISYVSQEIV